MSFVQHSPWWNCWWSSRSSGSWSGCCCRLCKLLAKPLGACNVPITASRSGSLCTTTKVRSGDFRPGCVLTPKREKCLSIASIRPSLPNNPQILLLHFIAISGTPQKLTCTPGDQALSCDEAFGPVQIAEHFFVKIEQFMNCSTWIL